MDQFKEEASASYLSGLLIGHEVAGNAAGKRTLSRGAAQLCSLYGLAIEACGGSFTLEDQDAAARGLAAIAGGYRGLKFVVTRCPIVAILRGIQPEDAEPICISWRGWHRHR